MYTFIVILVVIASVLMCGIVLMQESKGGGLASSFSSYNQIMGVRKTNDVVENITWTLAAIMVVLAVVSTAFVPQAKSDQSVMQDMELPATGAANLPSIPADQSTPAE